MPRTATYPKPCKSGPGEMPPGGKDPIRQRKAMAAGGVGMTPSVGPVFKTGKAPAKGRSDKMKFKDAGT